MSSSTGADAAAAPEAIRARVSAAVSHAWADAVAAGRLPAIEDGVTAPVVEIERPANPSFGDFATNLAMKLARPLRRAPFQIAEALAASDEARFRVQAPAAPTLNIPSPEASFDPTALDKLLNLTGGDRSALSELIGSFLDDASKLLGELHRALETNNTHLLRRAGHTLKSSSRDFGAMALSQLGKQLEELGQQKTTSGAAELVTQAEAEYEPVRVALERVSKGE